MASDVSRRRDTGHYGGLQLGEDSPAAVVNKDEQCTRDESTLLSPCTNGTLFQSMEEATKDEDFEAEEKQSQRKSAIVILIIFVGSLLVMALLFYNFPELDE